MNCEKNTIFICVQFILEFIQQSVKLQIKWIN